MLLIEDQSHRIATFTEWLAETEFVLIVCRSGGQAKGVLTKGGTQVIAGILLDHDLTDATITEHDSFLSSTDVLPLIATNVRKQTPVLIHSHNHFMAPKMHRYLNSAGMEVTSVRFAALTKEIFDKWLQDVRDTWDLVDA